MKRLVCLVCVLALGAGACDNGNGGTDAGPADSGPSDSGTPALPALMVVTARDTEGNPTERGPADFSCLGTRTAPTPNAEGTVTLLAEDFFSGDPVEGLTVQFFRDNLPTLDGTCDAPCQSITTNATGTGTVTANEGAWYAYRVPAGEGISTGTPRDYLTVVQVNEAAPAADGTATLNVVQVATQNQILLLLGTSREESTAVLTGMLTDCNDDAVSNATLRVFDDAGEIELGFRSSGPRAFYFNGDSFPQATRRRTHDDGLYGAANLPLPSDNTLRVELWGATTEGGAAQMLTCEAVQVNADGITILNSGPDRSDGPANCSE